MSSPDFDVIVVGAGAVGLAIGREMALRGRSILILENQEGIGRGISSRNSEVIHAGIYYETGSLKHRLCVEGRRRLYRYLEDRHLPYNKCGKIIVATDPSQIKSLSTLVTRCKANDVEGIEILSAPDLRRLEPELSGVGGILSRETGIFDTHAYMVSLQGDFENANGIISFNTPLHSAHYDDGHFVVIAGAGDGQAELTAGMIINAAGLWATEVADRISGAPDVSQKIWFARGNYFTYSGSTPFKHLIYPMPEPGGLGTHLTLDMQGRGKFGPDVEWVDNIDFQPNASRRHRFLDAISRYWPEIANRELTIDFCGIRPKLSGPGEPARDFLINGPDAYGGRPLIQLFGIESPGLTSSLAIAGHVADMADGTA
jgi:L-2-hydroxyglutarate oxidase LhgO